MGHANAGSLGRLYVWGALKTADAAASASPGCAAAGHARRGICHQGPSSGQSGAGRAHTSTIRSSSYNCTSCSMQREGPSITWVHLGNGSLDNLHVPEYTSAAKHCQPHLHSLRCLSNADVASTATSTAACLKWPPSARPKAPSCAPASGTANHTCIALLEQRSCYQHGRLSQVAPISPPRALPITPASPCQTSTAAASTARLKWPPSARPKAHLPAALPSTPALLCLSNAAATSTAACLKWPPSARPEAPSCAHASTNNHTYVARCNTACCQHHQCPAH
jgi:hypothetical protein